MKIKGIIVLMLVLLALTGITGIAAAKDDPDGGGGGTGDAPKKHPDVTMDDVKKVTKSKVVYYYANAYAKNYVAGKSAFAWKFSKNKNKGVYCYSQAGPKNKASAYCKYVMK